MGTIKDRNGLDLQEAEDTKKKWQEYTEEFYKKKVLMTQITMMVWSLTLSQVPRMWSQAGLRKHDYEQS